VLGSLFYLLGIYLGTVVAGELLGPETAAILAVPMSIIMAVYLIPRIVYQQYFLAKLHRWARSDRDAVLMAYKLGTTGMLVLGGVAGLAAALGGWIGIPLLFGPQYAASAPVMAVLCLAIPLRFGAASTAALLNSGSQVRRKVLYQGGGAAAYVLALALTIPAYGVYGAAIATVAAEAVLFWLFWTAVKKHVVAAAKLPSWAAIRGQLTGGTHGSAR
jgi:O-antigen/teichoic acid export membrane protein